MEILVSFLTSQPPYYVAFLILAMAIWLSRYGVRLLANWLGITDRNARRLYAALIMAIWLLYYVYRIALRSIL